MLSVAMGNCKYNFVFFVCLANKEAEVNAEKVNKRDKRKTCMSTMLHQLIGLKKKTKNNQLL